MNMVALMFAIVIPLAAAVLILVIAKRLMTPRYFEENCPQRGNLPVDGGVFGLSTPARYITRSVGGWWYMLGVHCKDCGYIVQAGSDSKKHRHP